MADNKIEAPIPELNHLDFGASVPGMDDADYVPGTASDVVGGELSNTRSPFQVQATEIPKAMKYVDYIPGRIPSDEDRKAYRRALRRRQKTRPEGAVLLDSVDYRTPKDTKKHEDERDSLIKQLAKKIYSKEKRDRYDDALKVLNTASPDQLKHPNDAIKAALALVRQGKPPTKKEAMMLARNRQNFRDV